MKLTAKNLFYVLIGVIGVSLVLVLLGAYQANNFLKGKSSAVHDARLEVKVLEEKQRQLSKARADIQKYQSLAEIAQHIVPQDKDQAQTVREIVNIAAEHNIKLGVISFPSSTLGDGKTGQFSQLKPVKDISGVLILEITIQSASGSPATYKNFIDFLDALEHNRRTSLVKSISLQPDTISPGKVSFVLTLNEYIKP